MLSSCWRELAQCLLKAVELYENECAKHTDELENTNDWHQLQPLFIELRKSSNTALQLVAITTHSDLETSHQPNAQQVAPHVVQQEQHASHVPRQPQSHTAPEDPSHVQQQLQPRTDHEDPSHVQKQPQPRTKRQHKRKTCLPVKSKVKEQHQPHRKRPIDSDEQPYSKKKRYENLHDRLAECEWKDNKEIAFAESLLTRWRSEAFGEARRLSSHTFQSAFKTIGLLSNDQRTSTIELRLLKNAFYHAAVKEGFHNGVIWNNNGVKEMALKIRPNGEMDSEEYKAIENYVQAGRCFEQWVVELGGIEYLCILPDDGFERMYEDRHCLRMIPELVQNLRDSGIDDIKQKISWGTFNIRKHFALEISECSGWAINNFDPQQTSAAAKNASLAPSAISYTPPTVNEDPLDRRPTVFAADTAMADRLSGFNCNTILNGIPDSYSMYNKTKYPMLDMFNSMANMSNVHPHALLDDMFNSNAAPYSNHPTIVDAESYTNNVRYASDTPMVDDAPGTHHTSISSLTLDFPGVSRSYVAPRTSDNSYSLQGTYDIPFEHRISQAVS